MINNMEDNTVWIESNTISISSIENKKPSEPKVSIKETNGKSLSFIRDRIANGLCNNMDIKDFDKAREINFDSVFNILSDEWSSAFKNNEMIIAINVDNEQRKGKKNITVRYNPDTEFEYFTMSSCVSDGTLLFLYERLTDIFKKLVMAETYNTATAPDDYVENVFDYDLVYTVGDFILNDEYGDFGTEEKPWMKSRFSALLPLKCEYIKN